MLRMIMCIGCSVSSGRHERPACAPASPPSGGGVDGVRAGRDGRRRRGERLDRVGTLVERAIRAPWTLDGLLVTEAEAPGEIRSVCAMCGRGLPAKPRGQLGAPRRVYCSARCFAKTKKRGAVCAV